MAAYAPSRRGELLELFAQPRPPYGQNCARLGSAGGDMPTTLGFTPGAVEMIHGVAVADPYRWLEDRTSSETELWIGQQGERFERYLEQLGALHSLRKRVVEFVDVETIDQIGKVQNRFFYRKRRVGQEQASIFVMESEGHSERVLVHSAGQGPFVTVGICGISSDASLLAYEVKEGGEHTKAIYFVDVT